MPAARIRVIGIAEQLAILGLALLGCLIHTFLRGISPILFAASLPFFYSLSTTVRYARRFLSRMEDANLINTGAIWCADDPAAEIQRLLGLPDNASFRLTPEREQVLRNQVLRESWSIPILWQKEDAPQLLPLELLAKYGSTSETAALLKLT